MKNKKFLALILCLVVCFSVLTGCNLITRNDKAYYEAIVCTIDYKDGTRDEITKRELLLGYSSYGYSYEQNYGQSRKEAVLSTLDTIVNQHLTIKAVKDYYAKDGNGPLFTDNETTYLWDETYRTLYENLLDYYYEVSDTESAGSNEETDDENKLYKPYERDYYLKTVDGKLVLKKKTPSSTTRATYEIKKLESGEAFNLEKDASKTYLYDCLNDLSNGSTKVARNWKSALNEYVADIKENYSYKDFKTQKDAMLFEIGRVYEILRNNYLVEKYSEIYNRMNQQDSDLINITVDDILKYYSSSVRVDYETYKNNRAGFDSAILNGASEMDYIYEGAGQSDFFYIGYIKMQFDEVQQKAYKDLQSLTGTLPTRKEEEIQKVYDSVYASVRDSKTGEKTGEKVNAQKLLDTINRKLDALKYVDTVTAQTLTAKQLENKPLDMSVDDYVKELNASIESQNRETEIAKAEIFRDYLYLYNDDDTLKNADFNAVAGVDSQGNVLLGSTFAENKDVSNAIKDLYKNGEAKIGDTTGLVKAEDGYYVFFYAGKVDNLFGVGENFDASIHQENIRLLSSTRLNIFSNKTYLDKLYESLSKDNFSVFQNMNMQNLKSNYVVEKGIKEIDSKLKDLY